ncbi:hypothetical protein BC827DRAFT_256723 [Russula dissimulans]|nr:hypothetical protein BC827DRAFT_256723 [Russula dissimulans]
MVSHRCWSDPSDWCVKPSRNKRCIGSYVYRITSMCHLIQGRLDDTMQYPAPYQGRCVVCVRAHRVASRRFPMSRRVGGFCGWCGVITCAVMGDNSLAVIRSLALVVLFLDQRMRGTPSGRDDRSKQKMSAVINPHAQTDPQSTLLLAFA